MITLAGLAVRHRRHGRAPCRYYASGSMANATCCEGSDFDLWIREAALAVNVLDGSHANSRLRTGKPAAPLVTVVLRSASSRGVGKATCCGGSGFDLQIREAALGVNVLDGSHVHSSIRTGKPVAPIVLVVCGSSSSGIFRNATCCEGSGFDLWSREAALGVNVLDGSHANSSIRTGKPLAPPHNACRSEGTVDAVALLEG